MHRMKLPHEIICRTDNGAHPCRTPHAPYASVEESPEFAGTDDGGQPKMVNSYTPTDDGAAA